MAKKTDDDLYPPMTFDGMTYEELGRELGFDDMNLEDLARELFGDLFGLSQDPKREPRVTQAGPGKRNKPGDERK